MTKGKKRELKKRKEAKAKWLKQLAKQHCKEWGFMVGTCPGTTQCAKCFTVTEGPEACIGCTSEFASKEERQARSCSRSRNIH